MENKMTGKQLLIQIGINVVASAIVSYVMYKLLQAKAENSQQTAARQQVSTAPVVSTTPVVTAQTVSA